MTSGVYPRNTLKKPYRGFERVRMVHNHDRTATQAIVIVACDTCFELIERSASAVRLANREDRGFRCKACNAHRTLAMREEKRRVRASEPDAET